MRCVRTDEHVDPHTVEYRADEISSNNRLLRSVQPERNLWSIGIVGPEVRHDSDVQVEEGAPTGGGM